MRHALIVGGTGMLAGVTQHLAAQGSVVSLLARHPERVSGPGIRPVAVDYNDLPQLRASLQAAIAAAGPVSLAVLWLSNANPGVLEAITTAVASPGVPFRLIVVRGSRAADPGRAPTPALAAVPPHCRYAEVILGWVIEAWGSRWLTHAEIAAGVIDAIETERAESVVGVVRPWAMRP
jgi:hypothetical protein